MCLQPVVSPIGIEVFLFLCEFKCAKDGSFVFPAASSTFSHLLSVGGTRHVALKLATVEFIYVWSLIDAVRVSYYRP
jgi:hypothetical protein